MKQTILIYKIIVSKDISKNTIIYINFGLMLIIILKLILSLYLKVFLMINIINKSSNKANKWETLLYLFDSYFSMQLETY